MANASFPRPGNTHATISSNRTSESKAVDLLRMQMPFEWLMLSLQRGQPPCLPPCGYAEFYSGQNEQLIVCSFWSRFPGGEPQSGHGHFEEDSPW